MFSVLFPRVFCCSLLLFLSRAIVFKLLVALPSPQHLDKKQLLSFKVFEELFRFQLQCSNFGSVLFQFLLKHVATDFRFFKTRRLVGVFKAQSQFDLFLGFVVKKREDIFSVILCKVFELI